MSYVPYFASAGSDFERVAVTLVFQEEAQEGSQGQESFVVAITDDGAFEKDEYFRLVIVAAEDSVDIGRGELIIHIRDDDGE